MAKLGWFVVGAVAMVGTPLAYAAWGTARPPAAETPPIMALEEVDPAQQPLLTTASLQARTDAPTLTAAEFAPAALVRREAAAEPAAPRERSRAPASAASPAPAVAAPAAPAAVSRAPVVAAPKPQSAPRAAPPPTQPPVVAASPETRDAGAVMIAQVSRMKRTLRLTPEQQQQWAPVEAALRDIARQHAGRRADPSRALGGITLTSDETNRLYWAAAPLIMSLREDQKNDARQLARGMGLEQVASAF